jgi:predicted chitinase
MLKLPDIPHLVPALSAGARAYARVKNEEITTGPDPAVWVPLLNAALPPVGITTPCQVAAFLGQAMVEAGPTFQELVEDTNYTHAARLAMVFPNEFPTAADAADYVGQPERIANRVYADRLGNGDEASGDGWKFRGSGLFQLTGRDEIGKFADSVDLSAEDAAAWLRTPPGALAGAIAYWTGHNLGPLADQWLITEITQRVNGGAQLDLGVRIACSWTMRRVLEG